MRFPILFYFIFFICPVYLLAALGLPCRVQLSLVAESGDCSLYSLLSSCDPGPSRRVACGISRTRNRTRVPCVGRQILIHWATRGARFPILNLAVSSLFCECQCSSLPIVSVIVTMVLYPSFPIVFVATLLGRYYFLLSPLYG